MLKMLPKSFLHSFVFKSALVFAGGALLTAAIFSLALNEQGTSYADSYKLLAGLNDVLISRSLQLFSFTLLLSLLGIIILAIVYSHRVAGALHKLGMHTQRISSGDLDASVRLRNSDVLHELADDFNGVSGFYRGVLVPLEIKIRELEAILSDQEKQPLAESALSSKITERTDEISELLKQIKL